MLRAPTEKTSAKPAAWPDSRIRNLAFLCFLGAIFLHHCFVFLGFYGNDDANYAAYAAAVARGEGLSLTTSDHLELRWTPIYFTALLYRLFGINEFTTAAFGSVTLMLTGYYIKRIMRQTPLWTYITALVLFFLNYTIIFNTHRLLPDAGICLFIFGAYYYYLQAMEGNKNPRNIILFTLFIFLGMITKETIILAIPLFLILFIRDIFKKELVHFWRPAGILLLSIVFAYLLLFKIASGDWWHRYHVLTGNSYDSECNFAGLPFSETLNRITYYLWEAFLRNGDLLYLILGLCGFIYRRQVMPSRGQRELSVAFFILLLSSNFMSISLTGYTPLCHDPRHYLFLFPFAAISGSRLIAAYVGNPRKYLLVPALTWSACLALFIIGGGEIKFLYLLVSLIVMLPLFPRSVTGQMGGQLAFVILLAASMALRPLYDIYRDANSYYFDHRKLVLAAFKDKSQRSMVYTGDYLTISMSNFFLHYDRPFVSFSNLYNNDSISMGRGSHTFLLLNSAYNSRMDAGIRELSRTDNLSALHLISKEGPVHLYVVRDTMALKFLKPYAGSVH